MEFYESEELALIVERSAKLLEIKIDESATAEIAGRSRGTPRIANRLLRRVRDFALVKKVSNIDLETAKAALEMYEVDLIGLDRLDRAVLQALVERFNGGPVGLSTLAIAVGEEVETVESVAEPFLVRTGLMARTARGRVATPAGFSHLGHKSPQGWSLFDSTEA
jgi:Holliday junction DNA helicase RuvB